jgi:hypothetical protein
VYQLNDNIEIKNIRMIYLISITIRSVKIVPFMGGEIKSIFLYKKLYLYVFI